MLEKDTYQISVNAGQKAVDIAVGQLSNPEAAGRFIKEYQAKTGVLQTSDYILNVDCGSMQVVTSELAGSLEGAIQLYNESGFQKVRFQSADNIVLKLQLKRIATLVGMANYEII